MRGAPARCRCCGRPSARLRRARRRSPATERRRTPAPTSRFAPDCAGSSTAPPKPERVGCPVAPELTHGDAGSGARTQDLAGLVLGDGCGLPGRVALGAADDGAGGQVLAGARVADTGAPAA